MLKLREHVVILHQTSFTGTRVKVTGTRFNIAPNFIVLKLREHVVILHQTSSGFKLREHVVILHQTSSCLSYGNAL